VPCHFVSGDEEENKKKKKKEDENEDYRQNFKYYDDNEVK
jgi:hypothetical protein